MKAYKTRGVAIVFVSHNMQAVADLCETTLHLHGEVKAIGPTAADEAFDFCAQRVAQAIYIAGWIHDGGLSQNPQVPRGWVLAERDRSDRMIGLCYLSATGILMPVMSQASSIEHLFTIARECPDFVVSLPCGSKRPA